MIRKDAFVADGPVDSGVAHSLAVLINKYSLEKKKRVYILLCKTVIDL